jgi:DNA-binding phage protein
MAFEKVLRDLIRKGGLRKVARDLGVDHSSLFKSIQDGSNITLGRIEAILNLFGLELKAVKRREVKGIKARSKKRR